MRVANDGPDSQTAISDALARLKAIAPAGYAMALHVRYTTPTYLFQTYPKDWIDFYSQNGLVMRDPTVAWGFENTGMIRWADLVPIDEAGVIGMAAERGIRHGFTYATDSNASRSMTSFAQGERDFTNSEIAEISGLVDELHDMTASGVTLTPGTREQLRQMSISFTHP